MQYKYNKSTLELHGKFYTEYELWLNRDDRINGKSNRQLNWKYEDWLVHQLDFALYQLEEQELPKRGYY